MAGFRLTTLGGTELTGDGGAILSVLAQPKRFALLVYLAVEGSSGLIRRDTVASLFWPERDQATARANLRKALHFLRKSLGEDVIVTRGDEEVGIDSSLLHCDVVALLAGSDVPAGGTFLSGFHFSGASVEWEDWLEGVRARARAYAPVVDGPHAPNMRQAAPHKPLDGVRGPLVASSQLERWQRMGWGASALALLLAVGFGWALTRASGTPSPTRYDPIRLGSGAQFPGVVQRHYALPPDGSGILFRDSVGGKQGSWWKPLDDLEPSYLEGLDRVVAPVFSPDGGWIAFVRDAQLRKQPFAGGPSVLLADSVSDDFSPGIAWLTGGDILFEDARHDLLRVNQDGGTPHIVATAEEVGQVFFAHGLLGGSGVLVTGCDGWCDESVARLSFVDLERDTVLPLRSDVWMAWPMSDGRVVMVDGQGAVFASSFDPATGDLGPPTPLLDGVKVSPFPDMAVGEDGSLLYVAGDVEPFGERLVWVDRDGLSQTVDPNWPSSSRIGSISLSPDGGRLALGMRSDGDSTGEQIWIKELPEGALFPLTVGPPEARQPVWSPDGRTLAFITQVRQQDSTWSGFVSTLPADASSSEPEGLIQKDEIIDEVVLSGDWGTAVVSTTDPVAGHGDIAFTSLSAGEVWKRPFQSEGNEYGITLSPDGRWLAYISEFSGRPELYVRPFPGPGPRVQVSRNGAVEPRWAHSGEEIFFRSLRPGASPDEDTGFMFAVRVSTDPTFRVESMRSLFGNSGYVRGQGTPLYDVTADDQRFVMVTRYAPRRWRRGEAAYSRRWYWSENVQARLRR